MASIKSSVEDEEICPEKLEDNPVHGNVTNSSSLKLQSSLSSECSNASGANAGSANQPQFQQQASDSSKQVDLDTSDDELEYHSAESQEYQTPDEQSPDEQSADEQSAKEQSAKEQSTKKQGPDEQSPDEQSPDEQSAKEQSAKEQSAVSSGVKRLEESAVVLETTDQQLTEVKEGSDPNTTSHSPLPSTGTVAQSSDAQQRLEETPVSYSISSTLQSVMNGLQLKLDSQDHPSVSFTYALSPLTDKLTPVDWKLLVRKDMEYPHIRCHELQAGDNLQQLIAGFQKAHAVAVVLINTSDNYSLHPTFLSGMQEGHYPVLLVRNGDGMVLLNIVEQYEQNVLGRISVESFSMPVGTLQETGDALAQINSDQTTGEKPGFGQRIKKFFGFGEKSPPFNLKAQLKGLMLASGKPLIICSDSATFTMVMATFHQYEKHANPGSSDTKEAIVDINHHLAETFAQDFPFYLVLAYRMDMKFRIYQCEEMNVFIQSCIEKMETMDPQQIASTFLGFLQRCDFAVQFGGKTTTSVFQLLQQACFQMVTLSYNNKSSASQQRLVYARFMWVSLFLRVHAKRGVVMWSTANIWNTWNNEVIKTIFYLPMDSRMVKKGLDFGQQVDLPSYLTFSPALLTELFASEGRVRPFQHLSDYIRNLESYFSQERELLFFVTRMQNVYNPWLKQAGHGKFRALSVQGTLMGTLEEGIKFMDTLYTVWSKRKFNPHTFDTECRKWINLLLQLVDVTGPNPHIYLQKFLHGKTGVVMEYRQYIIDHVVKQTRAKFSQLSLQKFTSIYKAFQIWPHKFVKEYLEQYKVPSRVKINDDTLKELFGSVVKRFSGAQDHRYLLEFFQSMAERYHQDGRAEDLVVDLLKLKVPKLFAVERGREEDEAVAREFSAFLHNYILRCDPKHTILRKMRDIMGTISGQCYEFQQLILAVVQRQVVPDFKALQRQQFISRSPLYSVLQNLVAILSQDLSWLQALNTKQNFRWGIIASCCEKIPISEKRLEWVHLYEPAIVCLGGIYNSYFKGREFPVNKCLLKHSPSDSVEKYFDWVHQVQAALLRWNYKFRKEQINLFEIDNYATQQPRLQLIGETLCASSIIVDSQNTEAAKNRFLKASEQLNVLLIKYIPGKHNIKWCTLPSLLQGWGVALPPHLRELIAQQVVFPGEKETRFQHLKLTKALSLHELSNLVKGLESFLQPIIGILDILVFFKLHPSEMFDKYLQGYLKSESELEEQHSTNTPPAFSFTVQAFSAAGMQPEYHSSAEELSRDVLLRATNHTCDLILKLMQGTAAYLDIIAKGELNLSELDIEKEFGILRSCSDYLKLPLASCEGLAGVRNMLELFQYVNHIRTIHNVCEQYQLQGCLKDPQLVELCQLVEGLDFEESRANLTPCEASKKMNRIKKIWGSGSEANCLKLFTAIGDSTAFYQFVRDKQFVGEKGQAVFQQQYQLITAQLQHEEYNETVLNHLYAAFKIIQPFMNTHQPFQKLMSKVTSLNITKGLKQLQTVNTNITLIRLWFSRAEGDTLENVAKELDCIITTGNYLFQTSDTSGSGTELILEYSPSHSQPASQENSEVQCWNSEQINDFVRKLGFLDTEKEGGDKIKHFLHINEAAHKLLNLYVRLRELGHPQYIECTSKSLSCAINQEEADKMVSETEMMLTEWMQTVAELRDQYNWLLFFSMPKLLRLFHLLQGEPLKLELIVHEISFLCRNEQATWKNVQNMVEESIEDWHEYTQPDKAPMHVVGDFLRMVFNNHSLPNRCGKGLTQPRSISQHSFSPEPTQLLHYCPGYTQAQLIQLIVSIYDGVPESFEVFRCHPSSTEEDFNLFLKRVTKHPQQYLILEVNRLPFTVQEYLMQLYLINQKREMGISAQTSHLHLVETAPSVLRKMPSVQLKEHMESGPNLNFEKASKICLPQVVKPEDFTCVQLVYGHAGDGKTHYIQQQLAYSPAKLIVAVNEAFTPLNAISKLHTLPLNQKNCAIFFNFTMLPPGASVHESERAQHQQLMEVIGWFFFDLLMLGYVEDADTGKSFRIPGGLAWAIYVEVPTHDNRIPPEEALKHFQQEVPALGLLGRPHYIHPDTPYTVDEEVQLVCKYLKALQEKGIDRLYQEVGLYANQLVMFSSEPNLKDEECQQLLQKYMPEHVRKTKITQRLFIKYMNRRCNFLDSLSAFNFNMGQGEYVIDTKGKRIRTDTRKLGSTLMTTMLKEVMEFCDLDTKEKWSDKSHQQLIYDFKDGGGSLGLISLHPEKLSEEDKMKFKKIGVRIPSKHELYSRQILDKYLSRALNVELQDGRLTAIDDSAYVLTMDYTLKMLNIHERCQCGVPVIIEGETGVGKTALVEMLSKLWNYSLLLEWRRKRSQLLDLMKRSLGGISIEISEKYQVCAQMMERLIAGQDVTKEALLGQLPDPPDDYWQFYSKLHSILLSMKSDPVVTLLILPESQQQEASLEELFERAEKEGSAKSTTSLLYGVLSAQIESTFHKLNVHAALTPLVIWNHLKPVFTQAKKLQNAFENKSTPRAPSVTVFLDEVNTSSCLGLFKEIIVDKTFDGEPIPQNVFIVAACNPHRGNSLASHSQKETWVQGSYYVRQLHPTLRFLMWDYGSLDEDQEREYINAKMKMLNRQMPNSEECEMASLTELIMTSQSLMRHYACCQLSLGGLDEREARISSRSCVSQRDIQRVFTLYQWVMASYAKYQPYGERQDYSRRAVLVSLGIVYYMRLNNQYRKDYEQYLDKQVRLADEVSFSKAFSEELDWYIKQVELPPGIAKTQALKENLFATIVCTVTHTPLIIVGAPGSSKTLSFNLTIANLKGQESKKKLFRDITVFRSLDPHFYQCSRRTTSNEIQTVFSRAINRQRSHCKFKLPIYCVVFMDEAGLPEESHESLKVLHYHLDQKEVSFVAITNNILDAAKTNRAVSLFRPEASDEDLKTLAKGCFCTTPDNPPPQLKRNLEMIVKFCNSYSHLMAKPEFSQYFGLRDFIHFVSYLRRRLDHGQIFNQQLVMEALERNFNGSNNFEEICDKFLKMVQSSAKPVQRGILEVLRDSLEDRPQQHGRDMAEAEVRYKLLIDPSEDDSLIRLLFSFGVLQRKQTRMYVCSNFPGDSHLQKINTIAAIRHSAIEGHTVLMTQTDDIHECFYDLFNQHFRKIEDPKGGIRYYTNIAIGAHMKPSRVDPNFQCVVVVKKSEVKNTPAPFLNRFEKYCITHRSLLEEALSHLPPCIRIIVEAAMKKAQDFINCILGHSSLYGRQSETLDSLVLSLLPPLTHNYEPLKEATVADEPSKKPCMTDEPFNEPSDEPLKESSVANEPLKKSSVAHKPLKESSVTDEPLKESSVVDEPLEKSSVADKPLKESSVADKPLKESSDTDEPLKESSVADEPLKESSVTDELLKESSVVDEPLKESSVVDEPLEKSSVADKPLKESSVTDKPLKEPSMTDEPLKEPSIADESLNEPSVTDEFLKESSVTDEPLKEPSMTDEPLKEPSIADEFLKETSVTDEFFKESNVTDELLKESSVTDELLEETSVTDELLEETSVTDEPITMTNATDSSFKPPKEAGGINIILNPCVVDNSNDLKVFLMQELLQSLLHCAGFDILPSSLDELHLDTDSLFELVLSDPQFEGLLPNLSHSAAVQAVAEAMRVLHNAPAPQDGATQLSPEGCLVVTLFQQWLVRYFCKRLMQLMTSEAFILYRNMLPSSYLENYISFQAHFSLQELILKYLKHPEYPASSSTKLLCFSRSSPLIHQLPVQYPSSGQAATIVEQTFCDLVSPNSCQLVLYKLSSLLSQSRLQEMLREFVQSNTAKVCLLVVNMQETSRQVVNHIRILIEETEMISTQQAKLFVILLHFPPAQFFDPCYPSLFLRGWDHCYLDSVAHSAGQGLVDIQDWFWQCCFPEEAQQSPEKDSLMLALNKILPEAIPVLSSRIFFDSNQQRSFNRPMTVSQRNEALKELLFKKDVGRVLCERFRSYWKPAVMTEYLEKAAKFTKNHESTLNITDTIQTIFKDLFFDFLVCMLSQINEEFNIDILFDSHCTPAVKDLFLDILRVFPLPQLSQLHILSTRLSISTSEYFPKFPFFKVVCDAMENIVVQSHKDTNVQLNLLQEEEAESTPPDIHDFHKVYSALKDAISRRIVEKMKATPKECLVLAVEAMELHPDLWQHYFDDFLLRKLRLGGYQSGEAISQQILYRFFEQLHKQESLLRVVSLHCYVHIYHLDLAEMANILRPLNQMHKTMRVELQFPSPERNPSQQLANAIDPTQNSLGSLQHVAAFVVSMLFDAIKGYTCGRDATPEEMRVWFQAYRDMMTLSVVKKYVYMTLEPQIKRNEEGEVGKEVEVLEAQLNVMHAVFLAIQSSTSLEGEGDILLKGQKIFQTLVESHFTETLELRELCPHLGEVMSVVISEINPKSCYNRLLCEGFFAHFFSSYRRGYNTKDVQMFLELANEQDHWGANYAQQKQSTTDEISQGAVSISVFKLYLGRILGSCDQHNEQAGLSGPLMLYHHQPRSQIGRVLMAAPDLGSPAPYIPTFYQEYATTANHMNRMQQPLAHLYFLTVLEHLQAQKHNLSGLVRIANAITQECASSDNGEVESVVLWVELQAVLQVVLQELAIHLNPSDLHMGEVEPLKKDINKLLDDVETGGGETHGDGMVLALHMLKQLKSSQKFSKLLTEQYDSICGFLHCLQPIHEQLTIPSKSKSHFLPFMLPGAEETELGALYQHVREVMVGVHEGREDVENLVDIADECTQPVQIREDSSAYTENVAKDIVDKKYCFRMMVWLCAYYDFFDKKVTSNTLCDVMEDQLAPYLGEEGCIQLIQCFLDPKEMFCNPELLKSLWDPWSGRAEGDDNKIDYLFELFTNQQIEQSDIDLRHSLANLVGAVLACPPNSNHLWYHLFHPEKLPGTYMTGYMYNFTIGHGGYRYDCGVELSADGQYGRQEYVKHAERGTYTLHSLYFLLWANFGTLCMALLTQPKAQAAIQGPIISSWLSVRHYCVSQLRTIWAHIQNNLSLLDEERSFLVMSCTKRLYEIFVSENTDPGCPQGIFQTCDELDKYEKMWHTCIYQPSWSELKTEFDKYSQLWLDKLFIDIRHLGLFYPYFPSEQEFTHSLLSSEDIHNHSQGGDLFLLGRFAQEWPHLQAGGLLLPDLVEFYHWLHTALAHLVTYEDAIKLSIGRVVDLAEWRYGKDSKQGDHLRALYNRVKDGYNKYVKLIGGTIGAGACAALKQENKIDAIDDDTPLLHFLSESADEEEGNDCLYTMAAGIIAAHNAIIEGVYSSVQAKQHACLLPDEPAKVYPSEVKDFNCIVGQFSSLHGISDIVQLVRSRYQIPSFDVLIEPQQNVYTSPDLLQTVKAPGFQFNLLQEDIVSCFIAGKPLICIEPSSVLRTPFKFRQPSSTVMEAGHAADIVGSVLDMDDISEKLPDTFKVPLNETLQKQLECEFHSASYDTMVEVVSGLKNVARYLIKTLIAEQSSGGLEQQTVPQFMLKQYDHLKEREEVLKEIGVRSTTPSQLACVVELPLPFLYSCLQFFAIWVRDGMYDFNTLPFVVKTQMIHQDLESIQQIPLKWTGSHGDLLEEIREMIKVLKHSETHILKTANETAHKPIIQYLQEIQLLEEKDHLPRYVPPSILLQHYVSFRMALRRLALRVQKQVEIETKGGDAEKEWKEVVEDLWDNQLSHFQKGVYKDVHTGRYGFWDGSENESEDSLFDDLMNELALQSRTKEEGEGVVQSEDNLMNESAKESKTKEEGVGAVQPEDKVEGLAHVYKDPDFREKVRSMAKEYRDTQTLEKSAQNCTPEDVGQFLEEIGLGHHVAMFTEKDISGDMLLEPDQEMLEELGVTSALEGLKIKVLFRRSLQGGEVQYPLPTVLAFLEQNKLDKYSDIFQESGMDGDLLLEADDTVLKELGVSSAVDRKKIKTKYKTFVKGQQ